MKNNLEMSNSKNLKPLNESTQGKKAGREEDRGLNSKTLGQKGEEEEPLTEVGSGP